MKPVYVIRDKTPPHIHVRSADGEFTITIEDRIVEGRAKARIVHLVNSFIDENKSEILEIWNKAQRGERINKIKR